MNKMVKIIPAFVLMFIGIMWMVHAFLLLAGLSNWKSNASEMEAAVYSWAESKRSAGKLTEDDMREVFDERWIRIRVGDRERVFKEMVFQVNELHRLPFWPGFLALIAGALALLHVMFDPPSREAGEDPVGLE